MGEAADRSKLSRYSPHKQIQLDGNMRVWMFPIYCNNGHKSTDYKNWVNIWAVAKRAKVLFQSESWRG